MSKYSGYERYLARWLSRFPLVKSLVKYIYSRLVFIFSRKKYTNQSISYPAPCSINSQSSFFGYYDKSPANENGLILVQVTDQDTRKLPSSTHPIKLLVLDSGKNLLFEKEVKSYNWQQGCRPQWLNSECFIFNDFDIDKKSYVSRVFSILTKKQLKVFDFPVQVSFKAEYFISLNYRRLMAIRPDYGYRNLPPLDNESINNLNSDGLWKVDYNSGEEKLLISLSQAYSFNYRSEFSDAVHKFNHVMISENGRNIIFIHRYLLGGVRFDRLLLADSTTGVLTLLSDFGMVSHCFWANNDTVIGYMRGPDGVDGYWLIDISTQQFSPLPNYALQGFGDGHPHVFGDWLVTDTYPDKARMQHLLLCNWRSGEVKELGEFYHGFEFGGECRCDLHPRFSPDGKKVFFDSVFNGKRQLYVMDVDS
ncbi:hypothetical protein [Halomonas sp. RT37]|uniref:Glycosyl transferase n=1 Tax=Halomonas sp. RT37 TaxID=2950872 RepID=A0AAU7KMN4_9GAMM